MGQGRIDHLKLAVPKRVGRLTVDPYILGELPRQFVKVAGGAIIAPPSIVQTVGDVTAGRNAPCGVMLERCNTLDDMPVPRNLELGKHLFMIADEGLTVEHDR